MLAIKDNIEQAFKKINSTTSVEPEIQNTVIKIMILLEQGKVRVTEKVDGTWQINQWIKKAVLLFFKISNSKVISANFTQFYDKIPLQFTDFTVEQFKEHNIRIAPPACIRRGAHIGRNTVIMPSYINIGAYVDSGCMIDTWATVGSCAQIGKNVHLSGGAGIGGVLEPLQATPTIIEDNCFIGARSEIVEGVIIEENSVISMGVFIGQSTKIYDRTTDTILYGKVPKGSVVVPGSLPCSKSKCNLSCAVIVKKVDDKTRAKTSINELLREA